MKSTSKLVTVEVKHGSCDAGSRVAGAFVTEPYKQDKALKITESEDFSERQLF